jgi:hypothetical protein
VRAASNLIGPRQGPNGELRKGLRRDASDLAAVGQVPLVCREVRVSGQCLRLLGVDPGIGQGLAERPPPAVEVHGQRRVGHLEQYPLSVREFAIRIGHELPPRGVPHFDTKCALQVPPERPSMADLDLALASTLAAPGRFEVDNWWWRRRRRDRVLAR